MDWFALLAVQGTLKCLLHHHNLKASILWQWECVRGVLGLEYIVNVEQEEIKEGCGVCEKEPSRVDTAIWPEHLE